MGGVAWRSGARVRWRTWQRSREQRLEDQGGEAGKRVWHGTAACAAKKRVSKEPRE
jgi:hypothetical protein